MSGTALKIDVPEIVQHCIAPEPGQELGYLVLSRVTMPGMAHSVNQPVSFWHKRNHADPEQAGRSALLQLRALNAGGYVQHAIATVVMPSEDAWEVSAE